MIFLALVPVFVMSVGAVVILFNIQDMSHQLSSILSNTVPSLATSKDLVIEIKSMDLSLWKTFYLKSNPEEAKNFVFEYEDSLGRFNSNLDRYKKLEMPTNAAHLRDMAQEKWKTSESEFQQFGSLLEAAKFDDAMKKYESTIRPKFQEISEILSNVDLNNNNLLEAEKTAADKLSSKITTKSILFGCSLVAFLSFIFALLTTSKITEKLLDITQDLNTQSDLTKDQTRDMANSSKNLADASSKAAGAIHKTSTAMEEIRMMIHKSNENAQSTASMSKQNITSLEKGKSSLEEVKSSFSDIQIANESMIKVVDNSNRRITEILDVIDGISLKTAAINEIVFQTKLLSFNASVEAARAGEAGKGFAIVAQEIGNLAVNSGHAAKEISELIIESQKKVETIVSMTKSDMSEVTFAIKQKVGLSEKSLDTSLLMLSDLHENSEQVNRLVLEISSASHEQLLGVDDVNRAISELTSISNKNSDDSQQIASSSEVVLEKAELVNGISSRLRLIVSG